MHQARRLRPIQPGEIADICSKSRAIVFEWIKAFRQGGFEALLLRGKPGPQGGELRGVPEKVARQLREGIQSGRWPTRRLPGSGSPANTACTSPTEPFGSG